MNKFYQVWAHFPTRQEWNLHQMPDSMVMAEAAAESLWCDAQGLGIDAVRIIVVEGVEVPCPGVPNPQGFKLSDEEMGKLASEMKRTL